MTNEDKLKAAKDYLNARRLGPKFPGWRWRPAAKTNVRNTIKRARKCTSGSD